jgi:DNA (cytosine-5)-methyltransferase 1
MNYLSVCSGIEAATVAWHHMGWKPIGFSEIEKFPSQVLAHHYPDVTNFGDMTKYKEWQIDGTVGLLVGGTPCQSFSVAGLRKGLEDPRGNLALTYCGILDHFRPKWFVWENVPGVLSSNGGRDFGSFLGALVELGYGFSYRVLDAQYFGVAQRRRRVFVVGHLGDWRPTAKVLFEFNCLRRDTAKGRKKGQETSRNFIPSIANTIQTTCNDYSRADGFNMIAYSYDDHREGLRIHKESTSTLCAAAGTGGGNVPLTMAIQGNLIGRDVGGPNGVGVSDRNTMYTLTKTDIHAVAFAQNQLGEVREANIFNTLNTNSNASGRNTPLLRQNMAVRRLTEVECERLQGFPDNYTNIKENCPSGARYKALGNSMAVPVMRWIGERINNYERL